MKTVTVQYGIRELSAEFGDNTTAAMLINDQTMKAGLGYGDNVVLTEAGVQLSGATVISSGATYRIEPRANEKAQDHKFLTVRYGIRQLKDAVPYNWTYGDLVRSSGWRAGLGYGDNVNCLVNGSAQSMGAVIPADAVVLIEPRCNAKATS